jgi:hypothetical protein
MDHVDMTDPSQAAPKSAAAPWFLLLCSAAAIVVALVPCAGLLAQQSPAWLVVGAGLAIFPLLPLAWHGLAEARRSDRGAASSTSRIRFALRSLAVALVVLGVSLGDMGPRRVVQNLTDLAGRIYAKPAATPAPAPPSSLPVTHHGLESFIPADATLVVGLAGSAAMEQLLAAHGVDTREKLAALATCKIDLESSRILIAARGSQTHMIVVRAPGIADERNLYCLVGVMGSDRLQIRTEGTGATRSLVVNGFLSRPLTFRLLDPTTVIATDEAWRNSVDKKLFSTGAATAQGRLAPPLDRIDRAATLWAASVGETARGTWDLALDARAEGNMFRLQGSSIPPSGDGDRAEISVRVPLAFASALPEGAVALGIRGVVAAIVATGASLSPSKALPSPPTPAASSTAVGAAVPSGAPAR